MNKQLVYQYISGLEKELLGVLSYEQFAQLIVCEIINQSIIQLHELRGGLITDEKTAKDLVLRNIQSFFTTSNIAKVEDKLQNWDNRLCYGHRGKISPTPKTIIEFRIACDISINQVIEKRDAMLHAVRNFTFKNEPKHERNAKSLIVILAGFLLLVLASIGIYSYSISNRYQRINADTVFDKWTGKSIDVYDPINRSTDD